MSLATHIKKTLYASQRLSEEVIREREEWQKWMKSLTEAELKHLVFIDESCAKTNMTPFYGWSKTGERCYGHTPCAWKRYTMLSSLRLDGASESILFENGLDKKTFTEYIYDVLLPTLKEGDVIVMDNLQAHKIDFSGLETKKVSMKNLPRYSQDYNPIEMMWSQIKNKLQKAEPRNCLELWREVSIAHLEVTSENSRGWFKGCGYLH